MTDLRETFAHIILIAKADIKKKDFDTNLNNAIASFDRRWNSWKGIQSKKYEAGDHNAKKALDVLNSESEILAQHIYDYFVEEEEQVDDPSVAKMASQIKEVIDEPVKEPEPTKEKDEPEPIKPEPTKSEPVATPEPEPLPEPPKEPVIEPAPVAEPEPAPPAEPPTPEEPYPSDSDEKALHQLFKEGKVTELSRKALGAAGLDVSFWSDLTSTGMKCGKYRLHKKAREEFYTLEKIA